MWWDFTFGHRLKRRSRVPPPSAPPPRATVRILTGREVLIGTRRPYPPWARQWSTDGPLVSGQKTTTFSEKYRTVRVRGLVGSGPRYPRPKGTV